MKQASVANQQLSFLGRLQALVNGYNAAMVVIYVLTGYIVVVSLVNLAMGVAARVEAGMLLLPGDKADPIYELGTSLGFWGTIYFCANFVLATRWRWVERLFNGLDKVYRAHALIGKITLTFVVLHVAILVAQALPNLALVATYLVPGRDLSYTLGLAGLLLLTGLIIVTIWWRLAYQTWLQSHKFLGLAYVLGGLHAIVLQVDWYMILLTALGGYAWFYNLVLYRRIARQYQGTLVANTRKQNVNELLIKLERALEGRPGQFVFLSVGRSARGVAVEAHPFSISGQPALNTLRVSAKILGDYTASLPNLVPGDEIKVYGPYGTFGERFLHGKGQAVWIAGGIGVTPFLSLLEHAAAAPAAHQRPIHFIWTVKTAEEAVYREEIEQLAQQLPHCTFYLHVSATEGRLTGAGLARLLGNETFSVATFFLCGPTPMTTTLKAALRQRGVPRAQIVSEEFALR
ncbi:MAG: ferric reductase-like transmembrane domain-containing protein [Chloroflexaceae bacterium]|nr:ferric reductase-like transmembrane domain-containing protein [Chloroflexaceae bacterium]